MVQDIRERAFAFACRVVRLHQHLVKLGETERSLARQLLRAGTSIGANLEEGRGGQSRADYVAKYSIALKEARETLYWLRLLAACDLIAADRIAPLVDQADELVAILTTIVKKARSEK
jgi:four helix bundle protein